MSIGTDGELNKEKPNNLCPFCGANIRSQLHYPLFECGTWKSASGNELIRSDKCYESQITQLRQLLREALKFVHDRATSYYKHRRVVAADGKWETLGEEELACSECHHKKVDGHSSGCGVGAAETFISHPEIKKLMEE